MSAPMLQTLQGDTLQDRRNWQRDKAALEVLIGALVDAGQATERGFLELGGKIRLFYDQAHGIAGMAGEVLPLLHGNTGETTLQQLQMLVERCNLWLAASTEQSTQISDLLKSVVQQIRGLDEPAVGLRKVIKMLHSLRVATRIEASRGYSSGGHVLADSLAEMSRLMHVKLSAICVRSEALAQIVTRALEMEEAIRADAIKTANLEVFTARYLLNDFMANCIESGVWSDRLKARSDDVTRNFGEMIAALQFQDITRQRFEHAQNALLNLGRYHDRSGQRADDHRDVDISRLFSRICRLQHDQLELACRDFLAAADTLSANLQDLAANVVTMATETKMLLQVTDAGCNSRLQTVVDAIRTIADCLRESRDIHRSAGTRLTDVCREVQEVAVLVAEIELLGEEIQLLSMNAAIGAAQARQGAGLEIIARNIQEIAEDAKTNALVLAGVCAGITSRTDHLQDVERHTQASSLNLDNLHEEASQHAARIEHNCRERMAMAGEVDQGASRLADDVGRVISTIDMRSEFVSKLSPVLDRLERLAASDDVAASTAASESLEELFNELEHCYTMDSERRVHQNFIDRGAPVPAADDLWAVNRHHDLGDNVDLF